MKAMAHSSTPQAKRGAHTVVLGCAKAERGRMAPLLEAFAAQEHHVELVSAVDESRQRWREAGQRYGTRAVYVACGSPGLAGGELAALRDELLSLGIPAACIWAAVVDWSQLDRLVRDVDRMLHAAPVVVPAPPPLSSARASTAGELASPPPPPQPVHGLGPGVVAAPIAPGPPPAPARLAPVGPSHAASHVSLVPQLSPAQGPRSPGPVEPMAPRLGRSGRAGRRIALALGGVAVAGLAGWVGLGMVGRTSGPGVETLAAATLDGAGSSVAGREPSASSPTPAAPSRPAPATPRAATDDAPSPTRARAPIAEPAEELDADDPGHPEPAALDDDALVYAALMQRKIRALDILLVSPEATRKIKGRRTPRVLQTHWADAHTYCEGLEIDGVGGWRLPTAGEFRTLGSSNMIDRRIYWSATEGDAFGSDRVVWNNHKKQMAPAPSAWKGGRVLCVRLQHPERTRPS
jgi:hypothetical protein